MTKIILTYFRTWNIFYNIYDTPNVPIQERASSLKPAVSNKNMFSLLRLTLFILGIKVTDSKHCAILADSVSSNENFNLTCLFTYYPLIGTFNK